MVILRFPELITLYLISLYQKNNNAAPSWRVLFDLVNEWIDDHKPDSIYITPISQIRLLQESVELLRDMGFVTAEGSPAVTAKGRELIKVLDPEWEYWPLRLPIRSAGPAWGEAEYEKER